MKIFFLALLVAMSSATFSQKNNFGSWNVINTKLTLSENWSVFNELQLRSQSFYKSFYYHEVKGGVSYAISKHFSLLMGIGKYITYSDGSSFKKPLTANEFRFWQQVTMNHFLERVKFEHRYRAEQRWFKTGYRNRFRYRLNAAAPLNRKKMAPKTLYVSAFEEVFFTNTAPYFERNRVFAGLGYQFSKNFTLQPGYIYQFDYRNNVGSGKHSFQLTFAIEIDAHKSSREKIPGNAD